MAIDIPPRIGGRSTVVCKRFRPNCHLTFILIIVVVVVVVADVGPWYPSKPYTKSYAQKPTKTIPNVGGLESSNEPRSNFGQIS